MELDGGVLMFMNSPSNCLEHLRDKFCGMNLGIMDYNVQCDCRSRMARWRPLKKLHVQVGCVGWGWSGWYLNTQVHSEVGCGLGGLVGSGNYAPEKYISIFLLFQEFPVGTLHICELMLDEFDIISAFDSSKTVQGVEILNPRGVRLTNEWTTNDLLPKLFHKFWKKYRGHLTFYYSGQASPASKTVPVFSIFHRHKKLPFFEVLLNIQKGILIFRYQGKISFQRTVVSYGESIDKLDSILLHIKRKEVEINIGCMTKKKIKLRQPLVKIPNTAKMFLHQYQNTEKYTVKNLLMFYSLKTPEKLCYFTYALAEVQTLLLMHWHLTSSKELAPFDKNDQLTHRIKYGLKGLIFEAKAYSFYNKKLATCSQDGETITYQKDESGIVLSKDIDRVPSLEQQVTQLYLEVEKLKNEFK
ncbi:hypothetical protein KUTeg_007267 [Tegillarca granosa]|uniref:Uncharacterized protein n=1 Tax=Tegillarca granosa TaxID=220873 RepID=A0ABQ9FGW7_TEGGR|nr:hypothetical protein KUTeg_007267 [Tegillarca granosa]